MIKQVLFAIFALMISLGSAFAAVEVNSADQASLEAIKGLGPVKSKAIIDERTKNGPFKSADDLVSRVKGLGNKSVTKLETAGLTVNGSSTPPTGAAKSGMAKTSASTAPAVPTATTSPGAPSNGMSKTKSVTTAAATTASAAAINPGSSTRKTSRRSKKAMAASAASAG